MATATAQKPQTEQSAPQQSRGAVAVIAPPRLPYHEAIEKRFGVDRSAWKALCESVFPSAKTTDAIVLALSYCRARKLDPFKKPVHIVPIWDSAKNAYVESVWPGIGEHRTTAFRTGGYAGMDPCVFGPDATETFEDKVKGKNGYETMKIALTFPAWAQITVYRMVQGTRVAFPGPRVMWREFYSRIGRSIIPNDRWQKAPYQMIEKCAESGALRRAYPEELGEDWTADEAGFFGAVDPKDITPEKVSVPAQEPTRAQFRQPATDVEDDAVQQDAGGTADQQHDPSASPAADAPGEAASDAPPSSPGEQSEPDGWPLYDSTGDTIGRFGVTEWLTEFNKLADGALQPRDRRNYMHNNWDSAKALLADDDVPEQVKATLRKRFEAFLPAKG